MRGEDLTDIRFSGAASVVVGIQQQQAIEQPETRSSRDRELRQGTRITNQSVTDALTRSRTRSNPVSPEKLEETREELQQAMEDYIVDASGDQGPWEIEISPSTADLRVLMKRSSSLRIEGGEAPMDWKTDIQGFVFDWFGHIQFGRDCQCNAQGTRACCQKTDRSGPRDYGC